MGGHNAPPTQATSATKLRTYSDVDLMNLATELAVYRSGIQLPPKICTIHQSQYFSLRKQHLMSDCIREVLPVSRGRYRHRCKDLSVTVENEIRNSSFLCPY